jgi:hypothetical protein
MCKFGKEYIAMKVYFLFLSLFLFAAAGCKKEGAETKPKIRILTVDKSDVLVNGVQAVILNIELEVLDKEGDVRDSIFITKSFGGFRTCTDNRNLNYNIPAYPEDNETKRLFRLKFATFTSTEFVLLPGTICRPGRDTAIFSIYVKDLAGNRSDTVRTDRIPL